MARGEGCEQGDPLAPVLFALGQHSALCSAASALHPAETLVAFLDDLYVVTTRGRARECRDTVIGGRFGDEAATFLRLLARQRAAAVPAHLRPAAPAAWVARWAALLAVAAQRAYATSLLELPFAGGVNGDETVPELLELLADARGELPVLASRLPARPL